MHAQPTQTALPPALTELVDTATGRRTRPEPVRGRVGGPAGNARLTSWTGLTLLLLFAVEGLTLVSIGALMRVHLFVGALLVAPVLLKSASTGWRIVRYYVGDRDYVQAGPPPIVLRVAGPLVILTSLAVLGTGLWLVVVGSTAHDPLFSVVGFGITWVTLHQLSFAAWFAVMTLHVLARTVPALRGVAPSRGASARRPAHEVPGGAVRGTLLVVTLVAGVALAVVVLAAATAWTS